MKKSAILAGVASLLLITAGCSTEKLESIFSMNNNSPIQLVINGKVQQFDDVAPFRKDNVIMIPLRKVTEELGATVKYKDPTADVLISKENMTILLHAGSDKMIGSNFVVVDGQRKDMGAPAMMVNKVTFVPLSFVDAIGGTQQWISQDQTVQISLKNVEDDGEIEQIKIFTKEGKSVPGNTGLSFSWGTKYIGQMTAENVPDGQGTMYSSSLTVLYEGNWDKGVPSGTGSIEVDAQKQITLTGTFVDGNLTTGKIAQKGVVFYEGDFGTRTITKGKLQLPDGFIFNGSFDRDQKSGTGIIYSSSGQKIYEGPVAFDGNLMLNDFTYKKGVPNFQGEAITK